MGGKEIDTVHNSRLGYFFGFWGGGGDDLFVFSELERGFRGVIKLIVIPVKTVVFVCRFIRLVRVSVYSSVFSYI